MGSTSTFQGCGESNTFVKEQASLVIHSLEWHRKIRVLFIFTKLFKIMLKFQLNIHTHSRNELELEYIFFVSSDQEH